MMCSLKVLKEKLFNHPYHKLEGKLFKWHILEAGGCPTNSFVCSFFIVLESQVPHDAASTPRSSHNLNVCKVSPGMSMMYHKYQSSTFFLHHQHHHRHHLLLVIVFELVKLPLELPLQNAHTRGCVFHVPSEYQPSCCFSTHFLLPYTLSPRLSPAIFSLAWAVLAY